MPAIRYNECFELAREIRKVGGRLSRERDRDLKGLGLTSNQSTTLLYLQSHPGCQITDLRDRLEITHQAARTLVERLKAKGLVDVVTSDTDGRARSINLSEDGMRLCAEIRKVGADTASHSLSSLTPEERSQLMALLRKVSENL